MDIRVSLYNESKWRRENRTAVSGSAFFEGTSEHLNTEQFCAQLQDCRSVSEVTEFVDRISGFYSFIHDLGDKIIASVDHIRSIPLYYSTSKKIITDNPREIIGKIDPADFDPELEAEYLLTGYVTGKETLCPSVKTLEAGTLVIINKHEEQISIKDHTEYFPDTYNADSPPEPKQQLKEAVVRAVERLCIVAAGRPIYVLLSGGYDSKLVLSELVRQQYDPVVAVSFGRSNFRDVTESREIAKRLNVERKYIEYTENTWSNWFQSETREQYCKRRHNLDSFPHHWAGPALFELKDRGELSSDAVFVSGQTIGSVGEHVPSQGTMQTDNDLKRHILTTHYDFWERNDELSDTMRDRITEKLSDSANLIGAYEQWEWRERQSKWMSQDGSLYSFMGHDWWFPLFDKDVMKTWEDLPAHARKGKSALIDISDRTFIRASDAENASDVSHTTVMNEIKAAIKSSPFENVARQLYRKYERKKGLGTHPLGYEGMFGPGQPGEYYCGNQSHHSYIIMHALNRMSFYPPDASGVPKDCELSMEKVRELPRVEYPH